MKLFKWRILPEAELAKLQDISGRQDGSPTAGSIVGSPRFDSAELGSIARNVTQQRLALQAELHDLQLELEALRRDSAAARAESAASEAKRKEARIEHMQTDFIAAASHELKTPLAGIEALGDALQMALEDDNLEAANTFAGHIKAEVRRMRALTEELLDLSRFDENPDSDSVSNLRAAIENALIMPQKAAIARGLVLSAHIDDSLPRTLFAKISPTDLSIILDNLLDNALHYTKEGSIDLSLRQDSDKKIWLLEVRDTGVGIASHDQPHVFERFYRADRSRSRDQGGTGLGLSLVKKAALRWNGSVVLQSELGKGSSFTVELPVA